MRYLRHAARAAMVLSVAACTALIAVAPTSAQSVKQYPLRDFFKNPERAYFRLSPDGKHIGFMQPYESRMNIFVQPFDRVGTSEGIKRVTAETARDIPNFFFKGPNHVLFTKDFGGDENFHVVTVDIRDGKVTDLTPHEGTRASILDSLPDDDDHILVTHNKRDKRFFDVFRINLKPVRKHRSLRTPATSPIG